MRISLDIAIGIVVLPPSRPLLAAIRHRICTPLDVVHALHKLHTEALRRVERDVAVHQPHAWVVRLEGDDNVTLPWQRDCVTTDRVVGREARSVAIPDAAVLHFEEVEVMAVEMNGVRDSGEVGGILLDDPVLELRG